MGRKCKRKEVCEWEKASVSSWADLEVMSNLLRSGFYRSKGLCVVSLSMSANTLCIWTHCFESKHHLPHCLFHQALYFQQKNLLLFGFLKHYVLYTLIWTLGVQQRIKSPFCEDACDYREVSSAVPVSYNTSLLVCAECSRPVPALTGWVTTPWASLGAGTSAVFSSFSFLPAESFTCPFALKHFKIMLFSLRENWFHSLFGLVFIFWDLVHPSWHSNWRVCAVIKMEWDFYIIYTFRFN